MTTYMMPRILPENIIPPPVNIQGVPAIRPTLPSNTIRKTMPYILPYNPNWAPRVYQAKPNYLFNYNDPNELNSMADIIMNSITDGGNFFHNTWGLLKKGTIDPIRAGQWGVAGVNNLINFAETMDLVAAPTKALLQGHGFAGAARAMGYGVEGRQNYDWETGNVLTEFVLEMLTDPLNWLTLGVKGLASTGAKAGIKAATKGVAKDLGITVTEQAYKKIAKQTVEAYMSKDSTAFITKTRELVDSLNRTGKVELPTVTGRDAIEQLSEFATAIDNATKVVRENAGFQINKSMYKFGRNVESVERHLLRMAFSPAIFPAWWLAKQGFSPAYRMIEKRLERKAAAHLRPDGNASFTDLPKFIEIMEDADTFSMMRQIKAEEGDVPRHIGNMLRQGVSADQDQIIDIFAKHGNDADKIVADIDKYMLEQNKVTLQEYLANLEEINTRMGRVFDDVFKTFKNFEERIKVIQGMQGAKSAEDRLKDASVRIDDVWNFLEDTIDTNEDRDLMHLITKLQNTVEEVSATSDNAIARELIAEFTGEAVPIREFLQLAEETIPKLRSQMKNPVPRMLREGFDKASEAFFMLDERTGLNLKDALESYVMRPYIRKTMETLDKVPEVTPGFKEIVAKDASIWVARTRIAYDKWSKSAISAYNANERIPEIRLPQLEESFEETMTYLKEYQKEMAVRLTVLEKELATMDFDQHWLKAMPSDRDRQASKAKINNLIEKSSRFIDTAQREVPIDNPKNTLQAVDEFKSSIRRYFQIPEEGDANLSDMRQASDEISLELTESFVDTLNNFLAADWNTPEYLSSFFEIQRYLRRVESRLEGIESRRLGYEEALQKGKEGTYRAERTGVAYTDSLGERPNYPTVGPKETTSEFLERARAIIHEAAPDKPVSKETLINLEEYYNNARRLEELQEIEKTGFTPDGPVQFPDSMPIHQAYAEVNAEIAQLMQRQETLRASAKELTSPDVNYKGVGTPPQVANADLRKETGRSVASSGEGQQTVQNKLPEVQELLQTLEDITPAKVLDATIKQSQGRQINSVKWESFSASLDLSVHGAIGELYRSIRTGTTPVGKFIREYAALENLSKVEYDALDVPTQELASIAADLKLNAELAKTYQNFLNTVFGTVQGLSEVQKSAFIATVQKWHYKKPMELLTRHDAIEEILDGVQVNLTAMHSDTKHSMEHYLDTINNWGSQMDPAWLRYFQNQNALHDATYDSLLLAKVLEYNFPDILQKYDGFIKVIGDIETTGKNAESQEILQMSLVSDKGTKIFEGYRKMTRETAEKKKPNDEVLEIMYPNVDPVDRVEAFLTDKRFIVKRADQEISEYHLLDDYLKALIKTRSQTPNPETKIALMYHNGATFDEGFIKAALKRNGLSGDAFHQAHAVDTYQEMLSKKPEIHLTSEGRAIMRRQLEDYASAMSLLGASKLINQRPGVLVSGLRRIDNIFRSGHHQKEIMPFIDVVQRTYQETMEIVDQVRRNSRSTIQTRFVDPFAELSGEEKYAVAAEILGVSEDWVKSLYGENINLPRLLSNKNSLSVFAYRKEMDWKLIKRYFNVGDSEEEMLQSTVIKMTRFAKKLDRSESFVKNRYVLEANAEHIRTALKNSVDAVQSSFYKALRVDTPDIISQFFILKELFDGDLLPAAKAEMSRLTAALQQVQNLKDAASQALATDLRNQINAYKVGDTIWPPSMPKELRGLLVDVKPIYEQAIYGRATTVPERIGRRAGTELLTEGALFADEVDRFYNRWLDKDALAFHSRGLDPSLARSPVYTAANAMMPVYRAMRRAAKMTERERALLVKQEHTAKNLMSLQQVTDLLAKSIKDPQHLLKTLAWDSPVITFGKRQTGDAVAFADAITLFLNNAKIYKEMGIEIVDLHERIYIVLDLRKNKLLGEKKARSFNGVSLERPEHNDLILKRLPKEFMEDYQAVLDSMRTLSDGRSSGTTGEMITPTKFREYYNAMPKEVRELLGDIDHLTKEENFWKELKYDWTNIGTIESRRFYNKYSYYTLMETFKHSLEFTAILAESTQQYTNLYFDAAFSINVGNMATAGLNSEEADRINQALLDALKQNDEFTLAALVQDTNPAGNGYKVMQLKPKTLADMKEARRLNAVILPYQVYATSMQTLNTSKFPVGFLNFWHKVIYTYKVGYLLDPGVVMRNYIDSTAKNLVSNDANIVEVAQMQIRAARMLNMYNKALTDVLKHNDHVFNFDNVHKYFDKYNKQTDFTEEQFKYIHGFIAYSASAGMTGPWQKYLKEQNFGHLDEANLWNTFIAMSDFLMEPNKWVEQINRMAQYMILEEKGFTQTQIFKKIAQTHFDYNVKSTADMYAELIIPFYTFTMRNLEFWINSVMQKPWLAGMFKDIMTPVWNFDGYDHEELGKNRSLQYQVLTGNIPINKLPGIRNLPIFNDSDSPTLKLNPSYMDVYNLLMDIPGAVMSLANPEGVDKLHLGSVEGRLAAPLQMMLEHQTSVEGGLAAGLFDTGVTLNSGDGKLWDNVINNLPFIGAFKSRYDLGAKYSERTGLNWQQLPLTQGTFGATQRWKPRRKYPKKVSNKATQEYYASGSPSGNHARGYQRNYYPNRYQKRIQYDSFYKKHYTKKGMSKLKLRSMPYTPENLAYRIKDLYWYFR